MADSTVDTKGQESTEETEATQQASTESTNDSTTSSTERTNEESSDKGDELPDWARKQIEKANKEAASYRVQLREVEEKFKGAKTDADLEAALKPLNEKLDESEARSRDLERKLIIREFGLDDDLAEFVTGDSAEEWERKAKALAERIAPDTQEEQSFVRRTPSGRNGNQTQSPVDPSEAAKRIIARNRY